MAKHIWITVPAYAGTVHIPTMRSILTDVLALRERGCSITVYDESCNPILADARAEIVAHFLASEATDLVFVDHDVVWEPNALLRLVDHQVDVVAGIYPHRAEPLSFPVSWLDAPELWADPATGLLEVEGAPTGFMAVTRACLEAMTDAYPELIYETDRTPSGRAHGLFEPYRTGQVKLSEDYSFCKRWRNIGGRIWIDPEIRMGHIGNKCFTAHLGDWLRGRARGEA